jgi:hypothetical protein
VVACDNCNANGGYYGGADSTQPHEAIAAWNTRAAVLEAAAPAQAGGEARLQLERVKSRIMGIDDGLNACKKIIDAARLFCESTMAEMDELEGTESASAPAEFMVLHEAVREFDADYPQTDKPPKNLVEHLLNVYYENGGHKVDSQHAAMTAVLSELGHHYIAQPPNVPHGAPGEETAKVPAWALKEDGSLGDTNVAKLGMAQEHFARLASERYERILELERTNLELSGHNATLTAELVAMKRERDDALAANELDRRNLHSIVSGIQQEITGRMWLIEGRGSYEWDDDKYRQEFGWAIGALREKLKPLADIASDLTNSPRNESGVERVRKLEALEADNAALRADLSETRTLMEQVVEENAKFGDRINALKQERDEFERKGQELASAYGNALIKIHDLEAALARATWQEITPENMPKMEQGANVYKSQK